MASAAREEERVEWPGREEEEREVRRRSGEAMTKQEGSGGRREREKGAKVKGEKTCSKTAHRGVLTIQ